MHRSGVYVCVVPRQRQPQRILTSDAAERDSKQKEKKIKILQASVISRDGGSPPPCVSGECKQQNCGVDDEGGGSGKEWEGAEGAEGAEVVSEIDA